MADINVAIIGLGNCASSLVQGVHKYADAAPDDSIPGIMHPVLGEYGIGDIKVVAAFDVDSSKVGLDISEAIYGAPQQHRQVLRCSPYWDNRPERHDPGRRRTVHVRRDREGPRPD